MIIIMTPILLAWFINSSNEYYHPSKATLVDDSNRASYCQDIERTNPNQITDEELENLDLEDFSNH